MSDQGLLSQAFGRIDTLNAQLAKATERVTYLEREIEQIRRYADNEEVEMVCKRALSRQVGRDG